MSRCRAVAPESRRTGFETQASAARTVVPLVDPQRGRDFAALTHPGQQYYADRIGDGVGHDQALQDARYSYGTRRI